MSADMKRTLAEASLDNLHDIIVPEPIGIFPLAPGWIVLILLFLTLLFHFGWQKYMLYIKAQYRRDAIAELETLTENSREDTLLLLSLAKRVGISAYGRERIATLRNDAWWDFMQSHSKTEIEAGLREEIDKALYAEKPLDDADYRALFLQIERWITTHKGAGDV